MSGAIEILLFARAPVLGTVKTRLAAGLGEHAALAAYRALAEAQIAEVARSGIPCTVWTTPASEIAAVSEWLAPARAVHAQVDGDLGARLAHATEEAFARGARGAILIGTDCPDLDAARLGRLASILESGRCAIQPALDGGYVALGLTRPCPAAFRGVDWGTESVCARTLDRLRESGLDPVVLEALSDIDLPEDWRRVSSRFSASPTHPSERPEAAR